MSNLTEAQQEAAKRATAGRTRVHTLFKKGLYWMVGLTVGLILIIQGSKQWGQINPIGNSGNSLGTTKEVEGPRLRQAGDTETMKVRIVDTIVIFTPTHKVSDGKTVYRTCLKVSKPVSLQSNADAGTEFHYVMYDPHAKNNHNKAKLSPGIKKFLERDSWTEVEVEFTLVETVAGVNPCRFTAWAGPVRLPLGQP